MGWKIENCLFHPRNDQGGRNPFKETSPVIASFSKSTNTQFNDALRWDERTINEASHHSVRSLRSRNERSLDSSTPTSITTHRIENLCSIMNECSRLSTLITLLSKSHFLILFPSSDWSIVERNFYPGNFLYTYDIFLGKKKQRTGSNLKVTPSPKHSLLFHCVFC